MSLKANMVTNARSFARRRALDWLSKSGTKRGQIEAARTLPVVHFPYLHSVPKFEADFFRALLKELSKTHEFISYSDAVSRLKNGPIDKPYAAFSFDDGFQSNVEAAHILEEFGTTGMFFVPTNAVGIPTVLRARSMFGFDDGCDEPIMSWADLESLKSRGHEIGNHTISHSTISNISLDQARNEIFGAAEVLRSRLGESKHFAWPNGRFHHFTPSAINLVFASDHISCASAERGAHTSIHAGTPQQLCIRREHVMTAWPVAHNLYFMANSALRATESDNHWPAGWASPGSPE